LEERGQAHLPDHELIGIEFCFLFERLSNGEYRARWNVSQVRKAGLPPLFFF
jgi:hypothetical protein